MRQAESPGWQAVFLHIRHLPERDVIAIGKKNRIVTKPPVAARRQNKHAIEKAFKLLDVVVLQGVHNADTKCAVRVCGITAPRSCNFLVDLFPAARESLFRPAHRAEWMPGAPLRHRLQARSHPKGRQARPGRPRWRYAGISRKVAPVSLGSMRPSSPAATASTEQFSNSRISRSLPGLWVAITSVSEPAMLLSVRQSYICNLLQLDQLADTLARKGQRHLGLGFREWRFSPWFGFPQCRRCR